MAKGNDSELYQNPILICWDFHILLNLYFSEPVWYSRDCIPKRKKTKQKLDINLLNKQINKMVPLPRTEPILVYCIVVYYTIVQYFPRVRVGCEFCMLTCFLKKSHKAELKGTLMKCYQHSLGNEQMCLKCIPNI